MSSTRAELMKTIRATANANAALSTAVDSDVYFDHVPDPDNTTMPWITFHFVGDVPINTFAGQTEDVTVQFSIFDDRPGVDNIEAIASDLDLAFDRQPLAYDTATQVGCIRDSQLGPTWFPDDRVWMRTVDYRILFEYP